MRHVTLVDAPVAVEYLPALQLIHVASAEAPVVVKYFPAVQSVHIEAPVVAEYLPAAQSVQVVEFAFEIFPAEHVLQLVWNVGQ